MNTIALGSKVKDSVTGLEGIAIARTQWLHGCVRISIQPQGLDDKGAPKPSHTFDEAQVETVEEKAVASTSAAAAEKARGGPIPEPQRQEDPVR